MHFMSFFGRSSVIALSYIEYGESKNWDQTFSQWCFSTLRYNDGARLVRLSIEVTSPPIDQRTNTERSFINF